MSKARIEIGGKEFDLEITPVEAKSEYCCGAFGDMVKHGIFKRNGAYPYQITKAEGSWSTGRVTHGWLVRFCPFCGRSQES